MTGVGRAKTLPKGLVYDLVSCTMNGIVTSRVFAIDEESEGSGTSGARSTSSDSTLPLLPDHPLTHTTPILVPSLCRTACMAVRVPPAMSPSLSVSIAEMEVMLDLAFRKRFMSSYDSSPSLTFPVRKRYRGDEGLTVGDEGPSIGVESLGLGGDEVVSEGMQRAALVVEIAVGQPLGLGYKVLRRREIALGEGQMPSVFEVGQSLRFVPESERPERVSALRQPTLTTWIDPEDGIAYIDVHVYPPPAPPVQIPPSPKWFSGSLHVSPAPSIAPSPISSPMISLTVSSPIASPTTAKAEGFFTELGAQVEMQGGLIHDHTGVTQKGPMNATGTSTSQRSANVVVDTRKRPSDASTTPSTAPAKKKQATTSLNTSTTPSTTPSKKKQAAT
uniref:Uncharacterized protein n=1 Tax=Tanacetum cinerariifolium TaxID=118510 RepID=A0A6L2K5K8_TANCI|nr:hypothetical protein [Tanacetum cinerariifolium]